MVVEFKYLSLLGIFPSLRYWDLFDRDMFDVPAAHMFFLFYFDKITTFILTGKAFSDLIARNILKIAERVVWHGSIFPCLVTLFAIFILIHGYFIKYLDDNNSFECFIAFLLDC